MKRANIILYILAGIITAQLILAIPEVIFSKTTYNILNLIYLCLSWLLMIVYLFIANKEEKNK